MTAKTATKNVKGRVTRKVRTKSTAARGKRKAPVNATSLKSRGRGGLQKKASAKGKTSKPTNSRKEEVRKPKPAATTKPHTAASSSKPPEAPSGHLATRKMLKTKALSKDFLFDLCRSIRKAVAPAIAAAKGREVVGTAPSGDATFELDKIAEKALLSFLKTSKMPVAYYSEDAGYTTFTSGQPRNLLVVDPIDGTRAARCGFETCVISVASTRVIERPQLQDVDNACIMEILGPRAFYAERGKGARVYLDGHPRKIRLSTNTDLETLAWSMTVPARPAELIFPTAAKLIDVTSLKGGFFACNSTSFSLMRLLTNQLDACVDFANRYYRDIPSVVEDQFINAGRGIVLGICPYDIAAAALIAKEAHCVVTDAYGDRLDDVLLLDSSVSNHRSLIAAANPELHANLLSYFDKRIQQFEGLLRRRRNSNAAN